MRLEPVKYKRFERNPVGCFEAHMMADGWGQTKYTNDSSSSVLLSAEVSEFIRLVDAFFRECADWQKLQKYAKRHGTEIRGDNFDTILAINFIGEVMDYTMQISNTTVLIYPYRKYQH